jgi:hypothetical protein
MRTRVTISVSVPKDAAPILVQDLETWAQNEDEIRDYSITTENEDDKSLD